MLRIRLRRGGKRNQPSYRVVVADKPAPRDGRFIENLGHYNPLTDPVTLEVKKDRVEHWMSLGAQPTETVHRLLYKHGIIETEPPKRVTKPTRAEREAAEAALAAENQDDDGAAEADTPSAEVTSEEETPEDSPS